MKTNLPIAVLFCVLAGFNAVTQAQITFTSADATAINAVGNVITNHYDSTTMSVDIGSPGATSWDFSALNSHITNTFTSVIPSSSPYFSDFPSSNVVFRFTETLDADTADGWQYSTQNPGNYFMDGIVVKSVIDSDTFLVTNVYSPSQLIFPLPFTYNSQWGSDFTATSTIYYNGFPFMTTNANHTETVVVDAWGNLTLPGGSVVQALRLRTDDRYTSVSPPSYERTISYSFITKYGTAVGVTATDTSASNSGIIQTDGVSWSSMNSSVNIENKDMLPTQFELYQNNPNPLNTNTSIRFSIGDRQFVQLKVYDNSGTEIATLVNEEKTPGSYEVKFDASRLSPGIYYYILHAGNFVESKKMILIR